MFLVSESADRDVTALLPELPVVTAQPPPLTREMSTAAAFHDVVMACRWHIEGNTAAVLQVRHAEGLHQLRIGLRRLSITLANFLPEAEELRTQAKGLFEVTGAARDLDVFLTELFEPVAGEFDPQEGIAILRARAEQARVRAWDAAVTRVSSQEFAGFLDEVTAVAERGLDWPVPLMQHAPAVLDGHLSRVRKRGKGLKAMPHDGAHRLRIALKKLRYSADFFATLYKERPVQRYLGEIKKLQDLLGALNDAAQVRATLGRLMMEEAANASVQADLSFAAGLINGWHHARASGLKRKAHKVWRAFKQSEPFWA